MPRRRKIPTRKNFAFLIPLAPYAAAGATFALKATAVALVGGTVGTAVYSKYVASEEEERRKHLPKIADELAANIRRLEQGMSVGFDMPTSLWVSPTDDAQASLRVAWLYMLAAVKNPNYKAKLLDEAKYELSEFLRLEGGYGASYPANAPELQFSYNRMMAELNKLGITQSLVPFITAVTTTQEPDQIAEQRQFENQMKEDASLTTAVTKSFTDAYEGSKEFGSSITQSGKCGTDLLKGLVTGKKPENCDLTTLQWIRVQGVVYGSIGLFAAIKILPPLLRVAQPIVKRLSQKRY